MGNKVLMPLLGESVVDGKISKWLKQVGDPIKMYEPILEVETDKVTTEVTASSEGVLLARYAEEGDVVEVGRILAFVGQTGETPPAGAEGEPVSATAPATVATAPVAAQSTGVAPAQASSPAPMHASRTRINGKRISPVVARIAAEHDIDVTKVQGTGKDGRVTKQDMLAFIEQAIASPTISAPVPASRPVTTPSAAPVAMPGEVVPLTAIRRSIAEHMVRSKHTSPHATTYFEIDMSRVMAHRAAHKAAFERDGANLTFTPYLAAATTAALKENPMVNSSWSDAGIVLHRAIHLGIAVALGNQGLIVPVIKNADSLNLLGLARAVNDLADRARNNKLKPDDVQGGTFTITNHGTSGSLFGLPIISQPQSAIMGVGRIEKRVVVVTNDGVDSIAIKPMAYVSLTFDHRVLDGEGADNFMQSFKHHIENWS
jgi:2-oxoglutarate dehydrogenase E2 component (dihydrolipoamide succinyltransferase)